MNYYAEYAVNYAGILMILGATGLAVYVGIKMPLTKAGWKKKWEEMKQ